MYSIEVDGDLLYSSDLDDQAFTIYNAKCTWELNKSGSLEFVLPPSNLMYDSIQKLKSTVVLKQNNVEIWRGRVLDDEKDWNNCKKIFCEGMLSYLLDSRVRPHSWSKGITVRNFLGELILAHNKVVDDHKKFGVNDSDKFCEIADADTIIYNDSNDYPTTLDEIDKKLVSVFGGYLKAEYNHGNKLYYTSNSGSIGEQTISFGENLLDVTQYIDATNVFTVLIPLGSTYGEIEQAMPGYFGRELTSEETSKRLTIESVNDGKDYLEHEAAIKIFGRIEKTETFDGIFTANNLRDKGQAYLDSGVAMAVTLSINAIDLHLLDVDTDALKCGCYYRVVSTPHGIDTYFRLSKVTINLQKPDSSQYTFGAGFNVLTDQQAEAKKKTEDAYTVASSANGKASHVYVDLNGDKYVSSTAFSSYQEQVNNNFTAINTKLTSVFHYKGSKDTYDDLPMTGNIVGDVYNVSDTGANYAWDGEKWDKLSETIVDDDSGDTPTDGKSDWTLLTEYVLESNTSFFNVPVDDTGLTELYFECSVAHTTETPSSSVFRGGINAQAWYNVSLLPLFSIANLVNTGSWDEFVNGYLYKIAGLWRIGIVTSNRLTNAITGGITPRYSSSHAITEIPTISNLAFDNNSGSGIVPAGTVVRIFGR